MTPPEFARLVTLACHDLRTPLATVNGFTKTLLRGGGLDEQSERFLALIDAAAGQMSDLLDLLGLAARIEVGSYDPPLRQVDTLELATSDDDRVRVAGDGVLVELDESTIRRCLYALAAAALRHGEIDRVTWTVSGRILELAPIEPAAARVVTGDEPKDLGALVARMAIEHGGGSMHLDAGMLGVRL
jgi:signal transduction histidine kinase